MSTFDFKIDTAKVEAVAESLLRLNSAELEGIALRGINRALPLVYDESRRLMRSGVNLTDEYLRERMDTEPANDQADVSAVVVAFKPGGKRRPGTRPTNLRQYAAVQLQVPARFVNSNPRIAANAWGRNPRASGKWLKWKPRVGAASLGIPVGMKQAGISVEVVSGNRKTLPHAFYMKTSNGLLVMGHKGPRGPGSGKGKAKSLYSLSVAQLFRKQIANVIPFAGKTAAEQISDEARAVIARVFA